MGTKQVSCSRGDSRRQALDPQASKVPRSSSLEVEENPEAFFDCDSLEELLGVKMLAKQDIFHPLTFSKQLKAIDYVQQEKQLNQAIHEPTARKEFHSSYMDIPSDLFQVRGPEYLSSGTKSVNQKSLKQPSEVSPYHLIGVNMFKSPVKITNAAVQVADYRRYFESLPDPTPQETGNSVFPTHLVVNWLLSPLFSRREFYCVSHVFKLDPRLVTSDLALTTAFQRFRSASTKDRNSQFKYVFRIVDAPGALQKAVQGLGGERPVIIGNRLTTHYHEDPKGRYLEINMDVSSSRIASAINGLILKNLDTCMVDCSWLLEGQFEQELPERVLCNVRFSWIVADDVLVLLNDSGERVEVSSHTDSITTV